MSDIIRTVVDEAKTLTLTNVLIVALLVVVSFPAYVGYRLLNDERLIIQVSSSYEDMRYGLGDCTVYRAQEKGDKSDFIIRYTFRFDRFGSWYVAIRSQKQPSKEEARSACDILIRTVTKARKAMGGDVIPPGDVGRDDRLLEPPHPHR